MACKRFACLVQGQLDLPSVLEELEDVCGVEDVWSVLPHPHQTVVTQAFLELVLRGGGCGLGRALRDGGLLDAPVFTSHISKNIKKLLLSQLICLVQEGLLEFGDLLTREGVDHLLSLCPNWSIPSTEDLLCWSIDYPSGQSSTSDLAQQLSSSLLLSLSQSPHSEKVMDRVKQGVSSDSLNDLCTQILVGKLAEPSTESFHSVLGCQERWRYCCLSEGSKGLFSMLARTSDQLLSVLGSTLAYRADVHWGNLLSFTASLLYSSPQAVDQFKRGVCEMVSRALSEELMTLFHCSLLMVRQAALEGGHVSQSYDQWFKELCGLVTGKRQVQFLLKWLTELVPHEPVYALKAHLTLSCSALGVKKKDYTDLVKARLSELKESVNPLSSDISHSEVQSAAEDLEKALAIFKETGQVPKFLQQMKLVCCAYYQERFLRCLLSPTHHGNSDVQNLIGALEQKKMIPEKLLRVYKKSSSRDLVGGGPVRLIDELMDSGSLSHLSELSAQLSPSPHITAAHVEFMDGLLMRVCRVLSGSGVTPPLWLTPLLGMLSRHVVYCKALVVRLQDLLCEEPHTLTELQLCGLGTLCAFVWVCDSVLDTPISLGTQQAVTMRNLAEELFKTIPVWSCDLTVAKAIQLFAAHCLRCVETVCGERPVDLLSRWKYVEHRVGYSERSSHKVLCSFGDWVRWEVERGDKDYLSPDLWYLYAREQLTQFLLEPDSREQWCIKTFTTLCQLPLTTHGLTILMMLTSDISIPWVWRAVQVTLEKLPDEDSLFQRVVTLVCSLPSQALVGDNSPTFVADCLRSLMSQSRTPLLVLPLALTMHLSGAVSPELYAWSPIYHASLLCHAHHLKMLPSILHSQIDWLHRGGPLPEEVDPTVIGACLFYQVNCEYERFESMKANIVHLAKTSIEVCAVIMDCCVRQLAFKSSPHISMLISLLLKHCPDSILACSDLPPHQSVQTLRKEFPLPITTSYSLLLFNVLCGLSEAEVVLVTKRCPPLLGLVLSSHKAVLDAAKEGQGLLEVPSRATGIAKLCIQSSLQDDVKACSTNYHQSLTHWMLEHSS